jgi:hypothetical protein
MTARRQLPSWPVSPIPPPDPAHVWSEANFDEMSVLWGLSREERRQMRVLQERISDIKHWKNDPFEVIRYFREFKGELERVEKKFRAMIDWRKRNGMEHFLTKYGTPPSLLHQVPICVLQGTDKESDSIYLARLSTGDLYAIFKHFGINAMVDYVIFIRELTNRPEFWKPYEQATGHRVRRYTVIFDLEGLGAQHLRSNIRSAMKQTSRISQDFYAGWCKRILIIRAPAIFTYVWGVLKHIYDPQLLEVIHVSGHHDYLKVLDKYVDREVLPSSLFSEGKGRGMHGYFENINLQNGPIHSHCSSVAQSTSTRSGLQLVREEDATSNEGMVCASLLVKGSFVEGVEGGQNYFVDIDNN